MMQRRFINLFLSLILLCVINNTARAQDAVYLPFFEVMNLPESYQYSATRLYQSYLEGYSSLKIIPAKVKDSSAIAESASDARESAEAWNVPYYLKGSLNKMGETILVSLSMHSTSDGSLIWQRFEKALTENDVHLILERLAKGTNLAYFKELKGDINTLTDYQVVEKPIRESRTSFGISVIAAYPMINDKDDQLSGGLGGVFTFDAGNMIFDLKGEAFRNQRGRTYYVGMDALYPFGNRPNAFFASAGMAYGAMDYTIASNNYFSHYGYTHQLYQNSFNSGVIGFLGGGYIINRDADVQLRLSLKGYYGGFDLYQDAPHQPFGSLFSATVFFQ